MLEGVGENMCSLQRTLCRPRGWGAARKGTRVGDFSVCDSPRGCCPPSAGLRPWTFPPSVHRAASPSPVPGPQPAPGRACAFGCPAGSAPVPGLPRSPPPRAAPGSPPQDQRLPLPLRLLTAGRCGSDAMTRVSGPRGARQARRWHRTAPSGSRGQRWASSPDTPSRAQGLGAAAGRLPGRMGVSGRMCGRGGWRGSQARGGPPLPPPRRVPAGTAGLDGDLLGSSPCFLAGLPSFHLSVSSPLSGRFTSIFFPSFFIRRRHTSHFRGLLLVSDAPRRTPPGWTTLSGLPSPPARAPFSCSPLPTPRAPRCPSACPRPARAPALSSSRSPSPPPALAPGPGSALTSSRPHQPAGSLLRGRAGGRALFVPPSGARHASPPAGFHSRCLLGRSCFLRMSLLTSQTGSQPCYVPRGAPSSPQPGLTTCPPPGGQPQRAGFTHRARAGGTTPGLVPIPLLEGVPAHSHWLLAPGSGVPREGQGLGSRRRAACLPLSEGPGAGLRVGI